jgi:primosomal protein N' (replication factor Y)
MNVIEVIPIARTLGVETLSYFTALDIPPGALVKVPVRKKKVNAIVVASHPVGDLKSYLKTADFSMRKVDELSSVSFLSPEFMKAVQKVSEYYAAPIGSVLTHMVATPLFQFAEKYHAAQGNFPKTDTSTSRSKAEHFVVQSDDADRGSHHRSLIRQEFARKKSVMILVPTVEDGRYVHSLIEKGIEEYTVFIHGGLGKKELTSALTKITTEKHPIVLIVTGAFLGVPRADISSIIVERENGRGYRTQKRPFIDYRAAAEFFAQALNARIYMSDILLRTETLERFERSEFVESPPFKWRSLSTAQDTIVDMRPAEGAKNNFKILSDLAEETILANRTNSEHMIIYAVRRGVAPMTICGDCQNVVTCSTCSSPVVLHEQKNTAATPFFLCHRCGERRNAEETCIVCGSWKLGTVGIGIDLVAKKLRDKFSDIKIFMIDADSTKTEKAVKETLNEWKSSPGSVLLGTDMMLGYIHEPVHNVLVVSLDSLFSLPDFRIQEKIMYTLTKLRTLATQLFIIQTRKPDEKVLSYALKGNLADFHRQHIAERKQFNYPPFAVLIKITLEGKKDTIVREMESLQQFLAPHDIEVFPAFTHTIRGNSVLHGLIRIPRSEWPSPEIVTKLQSLPPYVMLKVDPESLL